ncbi:MAG: HD domain-containing phosphohydrolase [Planctomycetota bacterium]
MKILVVDDDDIARAMVRKILMKENHEVVLARDGEEALNILHHSDIRVVISDWNMPKMDGVQLCQRIREATSLSYIYVILVTSRSTKDEMLVGLWTGADDYITKPFDPMELMLRVRNAQRIVSLEVAAVTIFCLAKLAESKDGETGQHLERIRGYSKLLAAQIMTDEMIARQLPACFPELIHQTSPLHDIGKVGIPDSILLKPGSLNDEEWTVMKRHTEIGAETLDAALRTHPSAEFLRIARDIAWGHHERWDGSGYPRGLKGQDIPWAARIVALADVYDALTTRRVYKAAMPHEVARGIILQGTSNHFDPRVVQAFLATEGEFLALQQSRAEPSVQHETAQDPQAEVDVVAIG